MAALKVGRGTEPATDVGPLIDDRQRAKVAELVADAAERGARVLTGGQRARRAPATSTHPPCSPACPPTRACSPRRSSARSPPSPRSPPRSEALSAANRTDYGLVAYLYTRDLARALRVAERLETGMVGLNQGIVSNPAAPFGGVKQSGFGREGGFEGIDEYLETKYVAIATEAR